MTYDFRIAAADTGTMYRDLASALEGLVAGEPDPIANMANVAALIWETLPDLNWAGFYRNVGGELVLGPFQGRPACIRIPFGTGVCGVAAQTRAVQRVEDVNAFPGHIACDSASNSEIVVPLVRHGELLITARRFRTQEANRADARRRLAEMIAAAHIVRAKRKPTRPSRAAKAQRVEQKRQRSAVKQTRGKVTFD